MRIMIPTALAVCFFMANAALAADSAVPTVKIGVVDMQDVATRSEPAQAARKQMESKFGKERQTLEKQGEDLKKRAESLKSAKTSEEKKLDFTPRQAGPGSKNPQLPAPGGTGRNQAAPGDDDPCLFRIR